MGPHCISILPSSCQDRCWRSGQAKPDRAPCAEGPSRRKLKVQNAEKYHWRPRQLLAQICRIYVQLGRADRQGVFAASIAQDERCYRPSMFDEAAHVG